MRKYLDILNEAVAPYRPLFNGLPNVDDGDIDSEIELIEKEFGRKDRVTHALKVVRVGMMERLIKDGVEIDPRVVKRFNRGIQNSSNLSSRAMMAELRHFLSLVQTYPFLNEISWDVPFDALVGEFEKQKDRIEKKSSNGLVIQHGDTPIIKFPNGWAWWRLNRGGCPDEAKAMGHCGNGNGGRGQNILSLRKRTDDGMWEPMLTFIYNRNDGSLGEMKGRANAKPAPRYHPYIIKLLEHPSIKMIRGGGYMPENNFSLNDLDESDRNRILEEKPMLRSLEDAWFDARNDNEKKAQVIEAYSSYIEDSLEGEISYHVEGTDIVHSYNGEKYSSAGSQVLDDILTKIQEQLHGMEEEEVINHEAVKHLKKDLIKFFYDDINLCFEAGTIEYDETSYGESIEDFEDMPSFKHVIQIREILDYRDYEEDQGPFVGFIPYEDRLNNSGDYYWSEVYLDNSPAPMKWMAEKLSKGVKYGELATGLISQYSITEIDNNGYTPTINDPRQMSFLDDE